MREFVRAAVLAVLVFLVANDVKEILTSLSTSSSIKPVVDWMYPVSKASYRYRSNRKSQPSTPVEDGEVDSDDVSLGGADAGHLYDQNIDSSVGDDSSLNAVNYNSDVEINSDQNDNSKLGQDISQKKTLNPLQDPALEAVRKKLQAAGLLAANAMAASGSDSNLHSMGRSETDFSEEEKQQISMMKQHMTSVMQQWCLPKLVCELHASISDRGTLTEAELGLLSLIKETSLGTMGEVVSRYHFAAHMGQLLSGVDGNGCHNLYPNCPLSGNKVLQMVKKVRIR